MTVATARDQLIRAAKNLSRNLDALDRVDGERRRALLETYTNTAMEGLLHQTRPMKKLQQVSDWLDTFSELQFRYKFLVLDGPSKKGKTVFCRSLSPSRDKFLEVDCSGSADPDLRKCEALRHEFILLDEASVHMILKYKKLFQSSACVVSMSSSHQVSQLQGYGAQVPLDCRLQSFCCGDECVGGCRSRLDSDNMVYVDVQDPLWI